MKSKRYGEKGKVPPFRNERLYIAEGRWYFDTREGAQFGPYENQREVKKALAVFIAVNVSRLLTKRSDGDGERPGTTEGIDFMVEEILRFLDCREELGPLGALSWLKQRIVQIQTNEKGDPTKLERISALEYAHENLAHFIDEEPTLEFQV
jgi:hypothetical protein